MRKLAVFLMLPLAVSASALTGVKDKDKVVRETPASEASIQIMQHYADSLLQLIENYRRDISDQTTLGRVGLSPYFYQMIAPGTLYQQPVRQALGVDWKPGTNDVPRYLLSPDFGTDAELSRLYYSYQALGNMYVSNPGLIRATEQELQEGGKVMTNIETTIKSETKMQEEVQFSELDQEEVGEVHAILRRPNFWKFKGSNSLQLTQNFATDNWFQGKANHYNALGIVNVEANFNNQRKIQWDNRLDLQLGFQTNSESDQNKFKPTNNLVRYNSKLGVKAAKNWFYTLNVKAETQLVPNYQYNKEGDVMKRTTITDFLSPLNVDISVGIDWKWNLKRFTGSLYMSPFTYNVKYVDRLDLSTRYGVDKDHHTKHTFGPSSTAKFNWKIADNISWDGRLYWISNLHYTNVEFENTVTFSINKYLTSKFYFYPRFNDQSLKNRMPDDEGKNTGTYWMFKEWLSLGVSYNW